MHTMIEYLNTEVKLDQPLEIHMTGNYKLGAYSLNQIPQIILKRCPEKF